MEDNKEKDALENQEEKKETPEEQSTTTDEIEDKVAAGIVEAAEENKEEVEEDDPTAKLMRELTEQKDKYLRLFADFENLRRRAAKEKIDYIQQANASLIKSLLPVLDDFERALKAVEQEDAENEAMKSIKEGELLIYNKFYKTLQEKGLKPMEIKVGDPFDAERHDAITRVPAPSEEMKGKIMDVVEKGYYLGDKLIRFAKVVTGS